MWISPAARRSADGWITSTYTIRFDTAGREPAALTFAVPEAEADGISDRMEAPVMAMVFLAMALGEDLHVDAPLSPKFHYGLRQIQQYFHLWYPGVLKVVQIHCGGLEAGDEPGRETAACFSGGVDSFYTLWHHREATEPDPGHRLQYGLYVHGFDIPLEDAAFYRETAASYAHALASEGIGLLHCRTNLRPLLEPHVPWMTVHGAAIQAAGLFLQKRLGKLLIPSTNRYSLLNPPIGSNPFTDPLAATEALDFIHHGCEASRIQKIRTIAEWQPARDHLRVCFQKPGETVNCGHCKKCQKVMAPLWILGQLEAFRGFPAEFDPAAMTEACFADVDLTRFAPEVSYREELSALAARWRPEAQSLFPVHRPEEKEEKARSLFACFRDVFIR